MRLNGTTSELLSLFKKRSAISNCWFSKTTIIKKIISRYYNFMQLKVSYPTDIFLVPTLDIEIIWQLHLLHAELYEKDCLRLFNRIIDHQLVLDDVSQFIRKQAFLDTCHLYEERFGEKYCTLPIETDDRMTVPSYSYWDETYFECDENLLFDYENPFSFNETDIIKDIQWFDSFTYLSNERKYLSRSEIDQMKQSYEKFLYLAAKYPPTIEQSFLYSTYAVCLQLQTIKISFNFFIFSLILSGVVIFNNH